MTDRRVLLLSMPFLPLGHPSLGLSLLKSILVGRGFACDVVYPSFWLGEFLDGPPRTRLDLYNVLAMHNNAMAGEWVFARSCFGEEVEPGWEETGQYFRTTCRGAELEAEIDDLLHARWTDPFLDACLDRIDWTAYGLVGFTSTFYQNVASLALARRVKARHPELPIAIGGANCAGVMGLELARQFDWIDFVCRGEGDAVFPDLVEKLFGGGDPSTVAGFCGRWRGEFFDNGPARPIEDLDALPYPDHDDYFEHFRESVFADVLDAKVLMETSRGCWWGAKQHCTFCGLNPTGMAYRSKARDRALEEIVAMSERYGIRTIAMADNIIDFEYYKDLLPELVRLDLGLDLFYEVKANLGRDKVKLLKDAGVSRIQPGIESLSDEILRLMKKGTTTLQNIQLMKYAQEYGIALKWLLLYGFPGEPPEEYDRMADLIPSISHLEPPNMFPLLLERFSPYHSDPAAYGIRNVRPAPTYRSVYPVPPEALDNLAYCFDFEYGDGRDPDEYSRPLYRLIETWGQTFAPETKQLSFLRGPTRLLIVDRRPMVGQQTLLLTGLQQRVYDFCDEIRSRRAIDKMLAEPAASESIDWLASILQVPTDRGSVPDWMVEKESEDAGSIAPLSGSEATEAEVDAFLEAMLERRLMVGRGDRYLSLAVNHNSPAAGTPATTGHALYGF